MCPSIRAASASATAPSSRPANQRSPVSINQGRVGFRDLAIGRRGLAVLDVSINQGRVGFRDAWSKRQLGDDQRCPSIRAASASAT